MKITYLPVKHVKLLYFYLSRFVLAETDEYNIDEREVESSKIDVVAALRELIEEGMDKIDKSKTYIGRDCTIINARVGN